MYIPEFQAALDAVIERDPSLKSIVDTHEFPAFFAPKREDESSFEYLVRNVLSQQVSGAAGKAILAKFRNLMGCSDNEFPDPQHLLKFSVEQLRTAGLSLRKGEYVRGLAEAYMSGQLSDEMFTSMDDDEVVDKIVAIRGLGPWTAQMFLIFYLYRMDVFSPGDVGVQRGMRRYLKDRPELVKQIKHEDEVPASPGKSKKATAKTKLPPDLIHMEKIAASNFVPYRTAFQMILWKMSDIQMETVEARNEEQSKPPPKDNPVAEMQNDVPVTPNGSPRKRRKRD